jgi:serine/threonine-protein kinase
MTLLSPGQIVNGKYRVVRHIGDGGMGSVYEAHHEILNTRVALKLLHPDLSATGHAKRFLQEARASARIKSPHVVQIADADQTAEGMAFIVLEYLEGRTLRELYEDLHNAGQSLAFNEALDLALQMFEGVEAAHEAGIIHRDLKPDNVMITVDKKGGPLLKLLDFGIAKFDDPAKSDDKAGNKALTRPGSFLGTPEYMAPEQVYSADSVDARSDIFAMGVIVFEMLSARRPVLSDDPQEIAVAYLTGAFSKLDELRPDLPAELSAAVHRALAPQPRDRFTNVAEMRAAFEPFAPPRPASPSRLGVPSAANLTAPLSLGMIPSPTSKANAPASNPDAVRDGAASGPKPRAPAEPSPRPIPETRAYTSTPQPASIQPVTDPKGPAPTQGGPPAYEPTFKSGAPAIVGPPSISSELGGPGSGYPQPPRISGLPPVDAAPQPSLPMWPPPGPIAPSRPPPPRKSNTGLIVGIVIGFLVVAGGITTWALWYLGWLDPDPPAKSQKKSSGPAPAPKPAPKPAPQKPPPPAPPRNPGNVNH